MSTWGYVAIGIVLGVVLLPLSLWLGFKLFVWYFLRKVKNLVGELEGLGGALDVPLRVTLHPLSKKPDWLENEHAKGQVSELLEVGFQPAGEFEVRDLGDVSMACFVHPESGMAAYLCKHPALEDCFLDLVHVFEDGGSLTVSNAQDSKTDTCPQHPNLKLTGSTPKDLFQEMPKHLEGKAITPISRELAKETFEKGYAALMDWRVEKGGVSEAELLAQGGADMSEDERVEARETFRLQHLAKINELLRLRFSEQTDITIKEWEEAKDRLVFIHEQLGPDDLFTNFTEEMFYWAEYEFQKPSVGGQRGFEELLNRLPKHLSVEEFGTVSGTIEARVYLLPEAPDDDC